MQKSKGKSKGERPLFRPATPADIPVLQSLAHAIWHEAYADMISSEQIAYMLDLMYADHVIADEIRSGTVWEIIERNGNACGFVSFGLADNNAVKLSKIYIHQNVRGSGIAEIALRRVIAYAQENKRAAVYLTVNKQNNRAIRAYEKSGFVIADSAVFDIGNNFVMDDYIMQFLLPDSRA